ncbi:MAG: hypothetical protein ACRDUY_00825 [Nitriliruptorales bacterium]
MVGDHERFEKFALSHVLGGLGTSEAAEFRSHLLDCRDCRLRVAELRDIAAELAATERDERRRASVATQVARSAAQSEGEGSRFTFLAAPWFRISVLVVGLALLAGTFFWNFHLRRVTGEYERTLAAQSDALEMLASGDTLESKVSGGVRAVAAQQDGAVAVSLSDLPELAADEILVGWVLDADETEQFVIGDATAIAGQQVVAFVVETVGEVLVVTVEKRGTVPSEPGGRELVRIDLSR